MTRALIPIDAPAVTSEPERPRRAPAAGAPRHGNAPARSRPPHRENRRANAGHDDEQRTAAPQAAASPQTRTTAELSRLKLSPSPTLIFEVDASGLDDEPRRTRRCDVRLVGSVRNRPRPPQDNGDSEVSAVLIIRALTPTRLLACVRAVTRGGASVPPELLSQVMPIAEHAHDGFRPENLTERELAVLRMLADGLGTREIAEDLSYSERTVKSIVHDVLEKLNCRTRAHAVALATRHGVI